MLTPPRHLKKQNTEFSTTPRNHNAKEPRNTGSAQHGHEHHDPTDKARTDHRESTNSYTFELIRRWYRYISPEFQGGCHPKERNVSYTMHTLTPPYRGFYAQ